jgi:hypothetical protein
LGTVFLIAVILAIPNMADAIAEGQALGFPIATTIQATLTTRSSAGITVGEVYLFVILARSSSAPWRSRARRPG